MRTISCQELDALRRNQPELELIDVRTPAEFASARVPFARNVPLDRLDPETLAQRPGGKTAPLYVICQKGGRGQNACGKLAAAGFEDVVNVDGGTSAWEAAGLSVTRGARRTISLDRQVRIVAGGLALLGFVLGVAVHPYFHGLSGFIGAGLLFAGVTDTCGMAIVLGMMPWNQARA